IGLFDTPVIVGATIIYAYLLAITVFVLDILYAWVDPRVKVRLEGRRRARHCLSCAAIRPPRPFWRSSVCWAGSPCTRSLPCRTAPRDRGVAASGRIGHPADRARRGVKGDLPDLLGSAFTARARGSSGGHALRRPERAAAAPPRQVRTGPRRVPLRGRIASRGAADRVRTGARARRNRSPTPGLDDRAAVGHAHRHGIRTAG